MAVCFKQLVSEHIGSKARRSIFVSQTGKIG